MSRGKGPTIIVRRGKQRKHGNEAVVDKLKRLERAHNEEYREERERALARAGTDYGERLRVAQAARAKQHERAAEAAHILDEADY